MFFMIFEMINFVYLLHINISTKETIVLTIICILIIIYCYTSFTHPVIGILYNKYYNIIICDLSNYGSMVHTLIRLCVYFKSASKIFNRYSASADVDLAFLRLKAYRHLLNIVRSSSRSYLCRDN